MRLPRALIATLAFAASGATAPAALASSADVAATGAYLQANYSFVRAAVAEIPRSRSALHSLQARLSGECPNAAQGSPEDSSSEWLSNELIGDMVITADKVNLHLARTYLAAVARIHFTNAAVTRAIHTYSSDLRRLIALTPPPLCADVHAWAAAGFGAPPAASVSFDNVFLAVWVSPGLLPGQLASYETPADRALAARTHNLELDIGEYETFEEQTWAHVMNALQLLP